MVTFAPDETVQIVNVSVVNDNTLESTEMFTAMLTATPGSMVMIGAADTATATIIDDDSKPQCHPKCHPGLVYDLLAASSVSVAVIAMQLAAEVFVYVDSSLQCCV